MVSEYYEEGVENTPARILMTEVHGSGLYYRNCFQGKVFHFLEYDKRFEMARAQESSDFLREMVYGRLNWPTGLTEQAKIQYEQYLKEHIEQIASDFIRQKRGERAGMASSHVSPGTWAERTVYRSGKSGRQSEISGDFKYAYGVPETAFSIEKEKF